MRSNLQCPATNQSKLNGKYNHSKEEKNQSINQNHTGSDTDVQTDRGGHVRSYFNYMREGQKNYLKNNSWNFPNLQKSIDSQIEAQNKLKDMQQRLCQGASTDCSKAAIKGIS